MIRACVGGGYTKGVWWLLKGLADAVDTQLLCSYVSGALFFFKFRNNSWVLRDRRVGLIWD